MTGPNHFTYEVEDGIAIVTWDRPDMVMNVLTIEAMDEFEGFLDQMMADDAVKGMVVTTGKKDFAGGMDLAVLSSLRESGGDNAAQGIFDFTMNARLSAIRWMPRRTKAASRLHVRCAGFVRGLALRLRWPVTTG